MNTRLSESAFHFALDNTVDSVAVTDLDSVIQYVNPAFTTTTGFLPEDAIGQKPSILRSPHTTLETYEKMWDVILSGGWWRGEIINVKKTGEEWYCYLSISQIRNEKGEPFAYVGIGRDITEMKQLQFRLREANLEAIFMLSIACEAKDQVTGSHIQRVQCYSEVLAKALGLSDMEAEEIGYSSMMHDVGKLHVPDVILQKAGSLSQEEWEKMIQHTTEGAHILRDKPFYDTARAIAMNHHEKWDGSGYPLGKEGGEIPLAARIVTVADVFDALTTERPYKEAWTEEAALDELRSKKGVEYDADVVDALIALHESGEVSEIRKQFR